MPDNDAIKELRMVAERVLGRPVDDLIFKQRPSFFTTHQNASIQEVQPVIDGVRKSCVIGLNVIDVSGRASTGADGRTKWKLRDFIVPCDSEFFEFERPMSFVATPHSSSPIYLTINPVEGFFDPSPSDDVVVDVFTWDKDGNPAPRVTFSWRFRVPYIINFGDD